MNLMTIDFLFWPSNFEKTAIALANEEKLGFPNNVVGFIYGCHHFDLAVAPSYRREEFCNRKKIYSMNSVAICDDQQRTRFLAIGMICVF